MTVFKTTAEVAVNIFYTM